MQNENFSTPKKEKWFHRFSIILDVLFMKKGQETSHFFFEIDSFFAILNNKTFVSYDYLVVL